MNKDIHNSLNTSLIFLIISLLTDGFFSIMNLIFGGLIIILVIIEIFSELKT